MGSRDIIAVCQRHICSYPNDCAGFAIAVASSCGVFLFGNANTIVGMLNSGRRSVGGQAAAQAAADGELVIAGAQAPGHGHVVVVVDGPLNRGTYPYAFWGQYRGMTASGDATNVGFTRGNGTLNFAFGESVRDSVIYAAFTPVTTLLPKAGDNEGYLIHTFS